MSSFIMDTKSISVITNAIAKVYNMGYNYTHIYTSSDFNDNIFNIFNKERLKRGLSEVQYGTDISGYEIYSALYEMNIEAVNVIRKTTHSVPEIMSHSEGIIKYLNYDAENRCLIIPDNYYQLLKTIKCYLYQCNEGNIHTYPLFKCVEELRDNLQTLIIENNILYVNAE